MGFFLFLLQNIAVWSAATAGPGAVPLFHLRNPDSAQYIGFLALARTHTLLPNLHMAWRTEPAMFNPLFLSTGRIGAWLGWNPAFTLLGLQALLMIAAGVVLFWVLDALFETRAQKVAAVIAALVSMPLTMFALGLARLVAPGLAPFFFLGTIELSYASADGLLRGGLSNGPTLTFGTSAMLLSLGLATARLKTGRRLYSWLLAATVFLSAFVHPFEVFVIVPSVALGFLWLERKAWRELIPVFVAAGLGLAPQVYILLTHPWMKDLSQSFDTDMGFSRLILGYGIGFLAVPYLLLMRAFPRTPADRFLLLWWALTIVICLLPGAPFPPHLLDGFSLVTGMLIVRLASVDQKIQAMWRDRRTACLTAFSTLAVLCGGAYTGMYVQLARDGRSLDPQYLLSAAASTDEVSVVEALRTLVREEDLALAPDALSSLLVRAPMHSFASHQHLSLDYYRQQALSQKFYDHKMTARGIPRIPGELRHPLGGGSSRERGEGIPERP